MKFASGCLFILAVFAGFGFQPAAITVDYPLDGSVFPPEITPPTFLWRDVSAETSVWVIEIGFEDRAPAIRVESRGERMRIGEIDPEAVSTNNEAPKLTLEQASAHTWTPGAATWAAIKKRSAGSTATVTITGFRGQHRESPVSRGRTTILTSLDPVGAPIFYRDVPLMPNQSDKGVIKPIPADAIGLIKWRLKWVGEAKNHVVMERPATCANCHSFSLDGKTLGLDVDGPQNDRGLYALVNVAAQTSIRTQDVITWPAVRDAKVERLRASFMSQVSPDGRFVLTTIDDPEASKREGGRTLEDKYYNANFLDYKFLQVFYPTRGILAWYDRATKHLQPLPGANDPRYVQTDGVWSPDGKHIVFARAEAKSPYPAGAKLAMYANDPNETQIQYSLYRMPFNDGKGGLPTPVAGGSNNGVSNNFPKVSPDGRWIVFVRCRNGQLMRPDSKLYIVPFAGGEARLMKCNTPLMNSWHTFSPNGRWLAFSSKSRSPYTQMFLTHIDENGNDTPPILVEGTTAANRAVNLPEFLNIAPGGLERITAPATEFYRQFNMAMELMKNNKYDEAIAQWRKALALNADDSKAHFNLGYALSERGLTAEAMAEYRRACYLDPEDAIAQAHFALALAQSGKLDEAISHYEQSLAVNPVNPAVEADLGVALFEAGKTGAGVEHLKRAVEIDPDYPDAQNKLGTILAKAGQPAEAVPHLERAVALNPESIEYRFNLGYVLGLTRNFAAAVPQLEKAVELSHSKEWQCLALLGSAYFETGRKDQAVKAVRLALELVRQDHNQELEKSLRATLERFLGN